MAMVASGSGDWRDSKEFETMGRCLCMVGTVVGCVAAVTGCASMAWMAELEKTTGLVLYVSANGNDAWTGRAPEREGADGPFATLERARDEIRRVRQETGLPAREARFFVGQASACHWRHLRKY